MKKYTCAVILFLLLLSSCSIQKMVYKIAGDALSGAGGSTVFTGETDPVLLGDALPVLLKLYETILEGDPKNSRLSVTTGSMFIMYANAFVQSPAERLSDDQYELYYSELDRAKSHYLRGLEYVMRGLEIKYPGFKQKLFDDQYKEIFSKLKKEDATALYWAGAGWFGAIAINPLDTSLFINVPKAVALLLKALDLDESYGSGSIHEVFIQLYASIPEYMIISPKSAEDSWPRTFIKEYYSPLGLAEASGMEKAEYHYNRSLELSGGLHAGAYVSYATGVAVKNGDLDLFLDCLDKALSVDVDIDPSSRLANIISMKKAALLKEKVDDYFILD